MKELKSELYRSDKEDKLRHEFVTLFKECPVPDNEILQHLGLFLSSKNLSRILFFDHIYKQIVDVQGSVMEFGTRYGPNLATFAALRGIYEPFNRMRKIIGFDTFKGFPSLTSKDNKDSLLIKPGSLSVANDYEQYLEKIMQYHEDDNPMSHIKKFEIVVGDASVEIKHYLKRNPETIVALAFFDMDIYEPTKVCLSEIAPRLVKGSIVAFDQLNDHDCPGETTALSEVFFLKNLRIKRYIYASRVSYFVVE